MTSATLPTRSRVRVISSWIITGLLAFVFLGAGSAKLASQPVMVTLFQSFSYPLWFMTLTGLLEITAAVLMFIPRTVGLGSLLVVCIMIGAVVSLLIYDQAGTVTPLAVIGLVAAGLFRLRDGFKKPLVQPEANQCNVKGDIFIEAMANAVSAGAREASATAEVKRVPELVPLEVAKASYYKLDQPAEIATVAELAQYDAIVVGAPTRFGRMPFQ